jgi:DNA-directed RNA polymerase specialized sigma24 family protein
VALREPLAASAESLSALTGDPAEMAGAAVADFSVCYARELSSPVWFVMSRGADSHRAADVAQSAFAKAFVPRDRIQHRGTSALAGYLGYTSYPHRTLS